MRAAAFLASLILSVGVLTAGDTNKKSNPINQPSDPSLYTGPEVCAICHQPTPLIPPSRLSWGREPGSYERGPHWKTEIDTHKGPQWHGCEACHGPGKEHVDSGGDPKKIIGFPSLSPRQASERCLACHERNESHQNFLRSPHLANGVGCTTCHSVHSSNQRSLLVSTPPALCYGCHQNVMPDFSKPEHHRVNEGLMSCADCHNPHGSTVSKNLRTVASQGQICTKCHVDTAGPFVFEHAPTKQEGCVACHNPHGSANPHMLNRPQVNQLCLECHSTIMAQSIAPGAPTFHNQAQKYQQCVLCHVAVHGSNTDSTFFRR